MNQSLLALLPTVILAFNTATTTPKVEHGPPASPLSWTEVARDRESAAKPFTLPRGLLGVTEEPTTVKLVEFNDEDAFGESRQQTVWLAHFESVSVVRPDRVDSVNVGLYLAFAKKSNQLLCTFTEPSALWARSNVATVDVEASSHWKMYPAKYEDLRSNVVSVLAAFWREGGANPAYVGQIILRPRYNNNELGSTPATHPASNVWIAEALGTRFMERHGTVLTTYVRVYRDDNLKGFIGIYRP